MATMHRAFERPLTLHLPRVSPLPAVNRTLVRLVFATATIAVVGGICLGFIVGYAVATAMRIGP